MSDKIQFSKLCEDGEVVPFGFARVYSSQNLRPLIIAPFFFFFFFFLFFSFFHCFLLFSLFFSVFFLYIYFSFLFSFLSNKQGRRETSQPRRRREDRPTQNGGQPRREGRPPNQEGSGETIQPKRRKETAQPTGRGETAQPRGDDPTNRRGGSQTGRGQRGGVLPTNKGEREGGKEGETAQPTRGRETTNQQWRGDDPIKKVRGRPSTKKGGERPDDEGECLVLGSKSAQESGARANAHLTE